MTELRLNLGSFNQSDRIKQISAIFNSVNWFSNVGSDASDSIKRLVYQHLDRLGCTANSIRVVADIRSLEDYIKNKFDPHWMEAENAAYQDLLGKINESQITTSLDEVMPQIVTQLSSAVLNYSENRLPVRDRFLARVAAGSATETCYRYAMEIALDSSEPGTFASKFEVFRMGRWPLCLSKQQYIIY